MLELAGHHLVVPSLFSCEARTHVTGDHLAVWWGWKPSEPEVVVLGSEPPPADVLPEAPAASLPAETVEAAATSLEAAPSIQPASQPIEASTTAPQRRVTVPPELIQPASYSYQPHGGSF